MGQSLSDLDQTEPINVPVSEQIEILQNNLHPSIIRLVETNQKYDHMTHRQYEYMGRQIGLVMLNYDQLLKIRNLRMDLKFHVTLLQLKLKHIIAIATNPLFRRARLRDLQNYVINFQQYI